MTLKDLKIRLRHIKAGKRRYWGKHETAYLFYSAQQVELEYLIMRENEKKAN